MGMIDQHCSFCDAAPVCSARCGLLFVQQTGCSVSLLSPRGDWVSRHVDCTESTHAVNDLELCQHTIWITIFQAVDLTVCIFVSLCTILTMCNPNAKQIKDE